jgi:uracil-DNA glycosylase family 4
LVKHREKTAREKRAAYRACPYWGKPVPGFGAARARLLIVGLAPAAHGGNRTGRMFTGDGSADFLIPAMHRAGLANKPTSERRGDGLKLVGAYMTAVCRCAPPDNKPTPRELALCRPFLLREMSALNKVRAVLVLGKIAMDGYLAALKHNGHALRGLKFAHGTEYPMPAGLPRLFASYHPSRQNTQTGRLTARMLDSVFRKVAKD